MLTPRNPEKNAAGSGGLTVSSVGSSRFLSYIWGQVIFFFYEPRWSGSKASKEAAQGGGEPPATGMARDYDYLFKLLIIGDSGKPTPGMRDGKWALSCFFYKGRGRNAAVGRRCASTMRLQLVIL